MKKIASLLLPILPLLFYETKAGAISEQSIILSYNGPRKNIKSRNMIIKSYYGKGAGCRKGRCVR